MKKKSCLPCDKEYRIFGIALIISAIIIGFSGLYGMAVGLGVFGIFLILWCNL